MHVCSVGKGRPELTSHMYLNVLTMRIVADKLYGPIGKPHFPITIPEIVDLCSYYHL